MSYFYIEQQERLKTKKGEELLSADRRAEITPADVAPAPKPVEGKIAVRLGADGKPQVIVKE